MAGRAQQGRLQANPPNIFIFYLKTPSQSSKASKHWETGLCCKMYLGSFPIALKRITKMRQILKHFQKIMKTNKMTTKSSSAIGLASL